MNKRYKILFLAVVCFCLLGVSEVKAESVSKGGKLYWSNYGLSGCGAKWNYTRFKKVNGEEAYCVEERLKAPSTVSKTSNTFGIYCPEDNHKFCQTFRLWSSLAFEIVAKKGYSGNKKYVYLTALLNSYHKKHDGAGHAHNFISCNSGLKKIYDEITDKYNEVKSPFHPDGTKKLATPKFSADTFTMHKQGSYWMSSLITVSNLQKKVADNRVPTYTIKAKDGSYICHNTETHTGSSVGASGTCHSSVTVSGVSEYKLYVKTTGVSAGTSRKKLDNLISVSGTVSRTFRKPIFYYRDGGHQDVIIEKGTYKLTSTTSAKRSLAIPPTTTQTTTSNSTTGPKPYEIYASKIDEFGESLPGASFTVSINGTSHPMTKVSGSESDFMYTIPNVNGMSNIKICWEETGNPDGYLKSTDDASCMTVNPFSRGNACFDETDSKEETDTQYCNTNVKKCKVTDTSNNSTSYEAFDTGGSGCADDPTPTSEEVCYDTTSNQEVTDDPDCASHVKKCKITTGTDSEYVDVPAGGDCSSAVQPSTIHRTEVCYDDDHKRELDPKYCADDRHTYSPIEYENGQFSVMVENKENYVNISKKELTGEKEIPGAYLKICTKENYDKDKDKCEIAKNVDDRELTWISTEEATTVYGIKSGDYYIVETVAPYGYKLINIATEFSIDKSGKVTIGTKEVTDKLIVVNNEINKVTISKTDMATTKELPGAELMICNAVPTDEVKDESDKADDEGDEVSDDDSDENSGESGETTDTDVQEDENTEDVSDDQLSSDIIKFEGCDAKTKYTVPININGECDPVVLANGEDAKWKSGTSPHVVEGLNVGTYFLVEKTAPNGYATTESIQFSLLRDGTLVDKNCRSLKDSKIVMKDATIKQVKTGNAVVIAAIVLVGGALMMFGYYVVTHSPGYAGGIPLGRHSAARIRKRKIRK